MQRHLIETADERRKKRQEEIESNPEIMAYFERYDECDELGNPRTPRRKRWWLYRGEQRIEKKR